MSPDNTSHPTHISLIISQDKQSSDLFSIGLIQWNREMGDVTSHKRETGHVTQAWEEWRYTSVRGVTSHKRERGDVTQAWEGWRHTSARGVTSHKRERGDVTQAWEGWRHKSVREVTSLKLERGHVIQAWEEWRHTSLKGVTSHEPGKWWWFLPSIFWNLTIFFKIFWHLTILFTADVW